jgi:hypothetical protein
MPLLEWVLFVIWTQPGMRAAIIGAITFCFVFYFLLAMRDTQIIQETSSQHDNSIKELKNMLNICNYSATKRGGRRGEPTMAERKAVKR